MHVSPFTKVGLVLVPLAVAGAAESGVPRGLPPVFPDRPLVRAWAASLRGTLPPEAADCVRFQVEAHVPPAALEVMLRDTGGASGRDRRLAGLLDDASARCRRRHAV